jgi:hypothetical protein
MALSKKISPFIFLTVKIDVAYFTFSIYVIQAIRYRFTETHFDKEGLS